MGCKSKFLLHSVSKETQLFFRDFSWGLGSGSCDPGSWELSKWWISPDSLVQNLFIKSNLLKATSKKLRFFWERVYETCLKCSAFKVKTGVSQRGLEYIIGLSGPLERWVGLLETPLLWYATIYFTTAWLLTKWCQYLRASDTDWGLDRTP